MIFPSWLSNTLVVAGLLLATPALAYRPLTGLYENGLDAPVVTRSVSASLADRDGLLDSNWDTTIVLEQKDARDIAWVELNFALLGSQRSPVRMRKVVLNRDHPWRKGERWEYRLQENHLGWPGDATLVQVTTVAFTNGEFWEQGSGIKPALTPNEQIPSTSPETAKTVESIYLAPTVLLGSTPELSGQSGSGFISRPRVNPVPRDRPPQQGPPSMPRGPVTPEELLRR